METLPLRAGLYARVSSEMQRDNYSVEAQLQDDRAYCARANLVPVREYVDVESGRTTHRDQFQQMLADAEAHAFDVLIIPSWDRFSRSVADTIHTLDQLQHCGVRVESVREPIDGGSDTGWMMRTMHSTFAEWFVRRLSMQTARGKRLHAEKGGHNGVLAFGYVSTPRRHGGDGLPKVDPEAVPAVRLAFERYATDGYSANQIAALLNEQGLLPKPRGARTLPLWSPQTVLAMLQNPFYSGDVTYHGQRFLGKHEGIISRELFDQCQRVHERRRLRLGITARRGTHPYLLAGIARCARCGGPMHGCTHTVQRPVHRWYRCHARRRGIICSQRMVRADDAEAEVAAYLSGIHLPNDWQARVLALVAQSVGHEDDHGHERERIERELAKLRDLYVMTDIDRDEYQRRRDALKAQLPRLEPPRLPDLQQAGELLANIPAVWEGATMPERQRVLLALFAEVYLDCEHGPLVAVRIRPGLDGLFRLAHDE